MPSFSKPLLLAGVLSLASTASAGYIGSGGALDTIQWTASGPFQLGDLYFCCLGKGLYGYKKSLASKCSPGAGPTLRFVQGGKYNLTIHNTCTGQVDPAMGMSPNSTNLHIHGTHTSGEGNGDNVLRQVDPGQCIMQNYFIPVDHSPGTYWYHPHLHMLVLPQAGGGAFGQAIVEGAPAAVSKYDANVAKFLTNVNIERQLLATSTGLGNGDPRGAQLQLIQNQWHYLRILHVIPTGSGTQPSSFLASAKKGCQVYELATDGVPFSKVPFQKFGSPVHNFTVHAASRLDLAVKCSQTGNFAAYRFAGNTVAYFNVVSGKIGSETPFNNGNQQWVPIRPAYLYDLRDGKYPSVVTSVNATYPVVLGDDMTINGKSWDPNVPTEYFPYGPQYIQQFNVISSADHPYHIHQQHFQVVQRGGCGLAMREGEWYDSISDTNDKDCLVRLRMVDFTGKIVHHCHDLDHEDAGMMGYFDVPFAAPGSFEASSLFAPATPQFQCPAGVGRDAVDTQTSESSTSTTSENACPAAPVYPFVLMGISIGVAAVTIVSAVIIVRRSGGARMAIFEEMKTESFHAPVFQSPNTQMSRESPHV